MLRTKAQKTLHFTFICKGNYIEILLKVNMVHISPPLKACVGMQTLSRHKSPRYFNKTWIERKTGITQRKNWKPACTYTALRWQKQLHNSLILVTSPELYSNCWQCLMKLPRSQMPQLGTLSLCFRWNWYSKWLSIINSLISLWVFYKELKSSVIKATLQRVMKRDKWQE